MTLDANMNTNDIEDRFEQIAKMLFERFAIQKGEKKYLFKEIEFYFYNKNHRDIITHPRASKSLWWYVNDFGGIDINFTSSIECVNRENSKGNLPNSASLPIIFSICFKPSYYIQAGMIEQSTSCLICCCKGTNNY